MKKTVFFWALGLLGATGIHAATLTHLYDSGKTAAENGTALQAAVDAATAGDEIKVQAGTYIGNFSMREGVNVSGGWNEGFTAQTDYATILDANADGRVLNQSENYNTLTVWSNMTIQNGRFTAQQTDKAGAGVFLCDKGQVKHCLIQNNLFDAASGEASGGGVYENGYTTSVLVDDCIIRGNTASHGGGVRICGVIQNSIIEGNTTTINACGGVQLHYGGAMYNCIVRNNTGKDTGGVRLTGNKACTMANCLIVGNTATGTIGGVSVEGGIQNIYNCTIVANNQKSTNNTGRCGVRINVNADAPFYNNIVYGNMVNNVVQGNQLEFHATYLSDRAVKVFKNNAVGYSSEVGTNNILLTSTDPGFTDAANNDYTLLSTSNLVDAGDNTKAQGMHDLAGNARISGTTVDLGCYEYQYPVIADNYVHSDEDLQEAIDATVAGETVYVAAGTYYGNFTMKDGVNVSGGWDATFENQTDYATVLDAQNSGRVVNQPGNFSNLTIWSNLTIQHGNLTANKDNFGSGVFLCKNGQVNHCIIQDNTFTYSGNCQGGGVANDAVNSAADVLVDDCIIRRNQATHGGGVRIKGTIQNSVIEENSTTNNAGGGVHLFNGGCMYNCIIRNNTAGTVANAATGGVRMSGHPGGIIANCLIVGNHASDRIGGLALELNSGATIFHKVYGNTIVNNSQTSSTNPDWCGVRVNVGGPLQFCNNIVWGNKVGDVVQASQIMLLSSYSGQTNNFVHNAVVWNGKLSGGEDFEGVNTILLDKDTDPGFTDAANGDYTLVYPSPAGLIDSGHGGYFYETKDLAGNTRKMGVIDRGCYEYTYENPVANTYTREVTAGRYGTICLPFAVAAADIAGATIYKVLSFSDDLQSGLLLEEVDAMEAGKPYFFHASAANVSFGYIAEGTPASAGHENGLYGTITGEKVKGEGFYVLQNNELRQAFDGADDIEINLSANRAYIKLSEIPAYTVSEPSPRRRVIGIHQEQGSATGMDQMVDGAGENEKMIRNGQLLIIRDGKTYNVLGQSINQ